MNWNPFEVAAACLAAGLLPAAAALAFWAIRKANPKPRVVLREYMEFADRVFLVTVTDYDGVRFYEVSVESGRQLTREEAEELAAGFAAEMAGRGDLLAAEYRKDGLS